jgi:hypothetical protein
MSFKRNFYESNSNIGSDLETTPPPSKKNRNSFEICKVAHGYLFCSSGKRFTMAKLIESQFRDGKCFDTSDNNILNNKISCETNFEIINITIN